MTELWLDLSCPWCYGALPVLKRLVNEPFTWRFQRLHPMPPEGKPYRLTDDVIQYNRERNCPLGDIRWLPHPQLAHRLLVLARDLPVPDMWGLTETLWTAAWKEGLDYSDLAELKGRLALPSAIWRALEAGQGVDDHARALAIGLDGVPRIYRDGRIIPAWLDPAEVERSLNI